MHVLVSGAGVAGPTLAWFLAKAGVKVTIIEKSETLIASGQNVDIKGCGLTILEKMGVMEEVRQSHTSEIGTRFIDPRGRPFAPFPIVEGSSGSFSSEFEILRADLVNILYQATKDHPDVNYVFGQTVNTVLTNNESSVSVELSNGQVQAFDLLVAADGQWSSVRKMCFSPEDVHVLDKDMYHAYWTVPRLPSDNNWWNIYFALQRRTISLRPDPHGTARATITRMPCNDAQRKAWQTASRSGRKVQRELIREEFADAGWNAARLLDVMDQAHDFYFGAAQQIQMSRWSTGRVVCLGDAAFAPTSLTGMGTTLAIMGAYVLAGELSTLNHGEHPLRALAAYESRFRPFVVEQQKIPGFAPAIAHPETATKRWLVQLLLSAISLLVSALTAIPWIAKGLKEESAGKFPLPQYSSFETDVPQ